MNVIKYRPVGSSDPIMLVKVRQAVRRLPMRGETHLSQPKFPFPSQADRVMLSRGYIRAGRKA